MLRHGLLAVTLFATSWSTTATAANDDGPLARAERALEEMDYAQVLPLLADAARPALPPEARARYWRIKGTYHAVFEQRALAVAAFVELLRLEPQFVAPADASPKITTVIDRARARLAEATLPATPAAPDPPADAGEEPANAADGPANAADEPPNAADEPANAAAEPANAALSEPPVTALTTPTPAPAPAFYERWYFWVGVGVIVAAGVTTAVVASQPPYPSSDFGPIGLSR